MWLADQRQPERHQTCWRPQISWYRSAWISAAFVLFERACTLKQPKNKSFPFCMVWIGGPEYVRLLISVVSVDGQDEVAFEHSMERIVGHCLTNLQNVQVVMALMASLTHLVGSRSFNTGPMPSHESVPDNIYVVAYAFNALAESAALSTLAFAVFTRRSIGSQLYSSVAAVEWLLDTKTDRLLMIGQEIVLDAFMVSVSFGAWILLPEYGIVMCSCFLLFKFVALDSRKRSRDLVEALLYEDILRCAEHCSYRHTTVNSTTNSTAQSATCSDAPHHDEEAAM